MSGILVQQIRINDGVCVKHVRWGTLSDGVSQKSSNLKLSESSDSVSSLFENDEGFTGTVSTKCKSYESAQNESSSNNSVKIGRVRSNSTTFDESKVDKGNTLKYRRCIRPRDEILKVKSEWSTFGKSIMQKVGIAQKNKKPFKVGLIFCNSYAGTVNDLGDCAINDGLLAYDCLSGLDYEVFCFYDDSAENLKRIIRIVLKSPMISKVCLYFIGHGVRRRDTDRDESDGYDECFVFRDGILRDDDMRNLLCSSTPLSMQKKDLILISDCCHSGTIFDLSHSDYAKNHIKAISFGACMDAQTAKQDWIERKGNGVFSRYFWKGVVEEKLWGEELLKYVNEKVRVYQQKGVLEETGGGVGL